MSNGLPPAPRAVILSEGYVGLENQALGLAEAASWPTRIDRIAPRALWSRLPARLWPRPLDAVRGLTAGLPSADGAASSAADEIVVSAGGTAASVASALRRAGRVRAVVQVQNPRMPLGRFDVVVANRHDEIGGPNVVVTRTALHRVTPARLAAARAQWSAALRGGADRPLVSVLVGGANGRFRLGVSEAASLGDALARMARRDRLALAVTPSRRTDPAAVAVLRAALAPLGAYVWDGEGENPYLGLLAAADAIVATCDSVSMVSEAVATTASVQVAMLPGRSRRIALFLDGLRRDGRIGPFEGRFDPTPAPPIDDTESAAHDTRRRLGY